MYKNSENIMKTKDGAYIKNDNMIKVTGVTTVVRQDEECRTAGF